jgi:isopentenyl-diphosphate delta-isomerase
VPLRAADKGDSPKASLGSLFWDWGIPTAAALVEVRDAVHVPLIASGGLRNGLEVAKCLSLGADACGMARPMLESASRGRKALESFAAQTLLELRTTMFITGAKTSSDLRGVRKVITDPLSFWVE